MAIYGTGVYSSGFPPILTVMRITKLGFDDHGADATLLSILTIASVISMIAGFALAALLL
jgi:hypothetical protein